MLSNSFSGKTGQISFYAVCCAVLLLALPCALYAQSLGSAEISVLGMQVDVDTDPGEPGMNTHMTAVKNFPAAVGTFAGFPDSGTLPDFPPGWLVRAELSGPGLSETATLSATPNRSVEFPVLRVSGEYYLFGIRLEDENGATVLERDSRLPPVTVTVIDKLLVTQVKSRPLTADEIREKGIVIDEDNYTGMNFTVGLTLGSDNVEIDLPMLIPNSSGGVAIIPENSASYHSEPERFKGVSIPNLSLVGFTLAVPDDPDIQKLELPPISGIIVIPGNIAFLNQFFSVVIQATNVAPEGSGLNLENAAAVIVLPVGDDDMPGTADDPLGIAETSEGVKDRLELTDPENETDTIEPARTGSAEFLVEGIMEGTHKVTFDITGDLYIPSLGRTVEMKGRAAGSVRVRNPTFGIVLAHPDTVREGGDYSLFATVTNTSSSPANLFQLNLSSRSLSGAMLAEGETGERTLDMLGPGQAETFEYRLTARTTGKVTGTVFLADPKVNGSFILQTGVGDTGIPLSPDTLILPDTADYLPDEPDDLVTAAVRLLGQAYSVATAPAGTLPENIERISKTCVFDRAVKLAQAGLHAEFGESEIAAVQDILMDYFGSDLGRLGTFYSDSESETVAEDLEAFDILRRSSDAGRDFSDVLGRLVKFWSLGKPLAEVQTDWAELFASRPAHISFGVSSPDDSFFLKMTDSAGRVLGRSDDSETAREIPFADILALSQDEKILFAAAPDTGTYTFEAVFPEGASGTEISLILPAAADDVYGMKHAQFSPGPLPAGTRCVITFARDNTDIILNIDTTGDGISDQTVTADVSDVEDRPPSLITVQQWAKKNLPENRIDFSSGDPLGRLAGILFNEEVDADTAEVLSSYSMPAHTVTDVSLQPDRRMVFIMFGEPAGPFVSRELSISGVRDMREQEIQEGTAELAGDQDRGTAGMVSGVVMGPDGEPVPFAGIKYFQPVRCPECDYGEGWTKDYVISALTADAKGRYQIDFVLKNGYTARNNADIWLNENHAGGTDNFKLEAADPMTGDIGRASTRIQYDGQQMIVNIIIRGYGSIEGTVYDETGAALTGGVSVYAKNISTGEAYSSEAGILGQFEFPRLTVGNVILTATYGSNLNDALTGIVTANIPAAEMTVTQDIVLTEASSYGTVSGRVLENGGETGAADVQVQVKGVLLTGLDLYSREYAETVVGSVYTDESGFFMFENVPAGPVEVRAFRQSTYEQAAAKCILEKDGDAFLTLIFPGTQGEITGRVEDAYGNPSEGAKVVAGPVMTTTDQDGDFRITGLPMGNFRVYAQAPDSLAVSSISVDIVSSEPVDVLLTFEPLGTVRGTVFEADASTVRGYQRVQLWVGNDGVIAETVTDTAGEYGFVNYPVSQYSVRAVSSDYGDGGMAYTAVRYPGDIRIANIVFRGMAEITGQVLQKVNETDTAPAICDVVITRKVWRIIPNENRNEDNYYLDYVREIGEQADEETAEKIMQILDETGALDPPPDFFMLRDEPVLVRSDILGPDGEVTGEYHYTGSVTGGPFTVAAFGPFLSPAERTGYIEQFSGTGAQVVNVEPPIILEPTVSEVEGTVYMPDGVTPANGEVRVTLSSLDSSGTVLVPGGGVEQPVLPNLTVSTDENGYFHFPLVLKGRFVMTADTGAPPAPEPDDPGGINTDRMYDGDDPVLNVRLYGQTGGVAPAGGKVAADIRLNNAGGISVLVVEKDSSDAETPLQGAKVTVRTASVLDDADVQPGLTGFTDENGEIVFLPVIEGGFSVSAVNTSNQAAGQTAGTAAADSPGHEIPVKVTLGAVTTEDGQVISAPVFGVVTGTVYKADGTPLSNPAQVRIIASGASILTTSGETGTYSAEYVPAGGIGIEAYEPFTARRGTAAGYLPAEQDAETDIPVTLIGLGTVSGRVMNAGGTQAVADADIILSASGNFTDPLVSRADAGGTYSLPGVPEGDYTVKANSFVEGGIRLSGEASGTMAGDGDHNTTDIFLEPAGSISGTVYVAGTVLDDDGNPVSDDPGVVSSGTVYIKRGSSVVRELQISDGVFSSDRYMLTGNYTLTARPGQVTGIINDGADADAVISYDGHEAEVSMVMLGTGTVKGTVLDSLCQNSPVSGAAVTLHSTGRFSSAFNTEFTGSDGSFSFSNVPLGDFSLTAKKDLLGASAAGKIEQNGQESVFDSICLQESGGVTGKAVFPDGSPAEGAVAELISADYAIRLAMMCDDKGEFLFEGIPSQDAAYTLSVHESSANGVAAREVQIVNGVTADLGEIVLDTDAPAVVSTAPGADSSDQDTATDIVVEFSENIDHASVNSDTFLVTADGLTVPGTAEVSDTTVTFEPAAALPDVTTVRVCVRGDKIGFEGQVLETGIRDTSGLGMAGDYVFTFTTRDGTPPGIVSISPRDGAAEVEPDSVIRLEFSESVSPDSVTSFTLSDSGGTLSGGILNEKPILGGRVVVFTPDAPLETDTSYTALLEGPVTDLAGNAMSEADISVTFTTLDTLPPGIPGLSFSGGPAVRGKTIEIKAESADAASVGFYADSQLAGTDSDIPFTYSLYLDPGLGDSVTVEAVSVDTAGNRSSPGELVIPVAENLVPDVAITSPGSPSDVTQGQEITVHVTASDDAGLTGISLTADSGAVADLAENYQAVSSAEADFTFTVPENRTSDITVRASAADVLGLSSFSEQIILKVTDTLAPQVVIGSPAQNTVFDPGTEVSVLILAADSSSIGNVGISTEGAAAVTAEHNFDDPATPVSEVLKFTMPASDTPGGEPVIITASAADTFGNTGYSEPLTVLMSDIAGPHVTGITPADGAGNVSVNTGVTVVFSEPVDPGAVSSETFTVTSVQDTDVTGTCVLTDSSTKAVWIPEQGFESGAVYDVMLADSITDPSGNPLTPFSSAFTVTGFAIVSPGDGETLEQGQTVTITAEAANTEGISAVDFYADGTKIATVTAAPYSIEYQVPAGSQMTLRAEAVAGGANASLTAAVSGPPETYSHAFHPARAADGNPDPDLRGGSAAIVMGEPRAWWEADLGSIMTAGDISITLMEGCCLESNRFAVLAASDPFDESDFAGAGLPLKYGNRAQEIYRTGADYDTGTVILTGPFTGRYIRVVSLENRYLALAEVGIFERKSVVGISEIQVQVTDPK